MKGLLLKDLYMTWKHCRSYLLILAVFIIAAVVSQEQFFFFYLVMICGMIPVNLLAYDEQAKWPAFSCTLPCSRAQLVSVKYLLGLLSQAAVIALVAVIQAIRMKPFQWSAYLTMLELMVFLACLSTAIACPLIFKLGVEKGRMGYYVMIGIVCAGSTIASNNLDSGVATSLEALPHLLVLAGLLIYGFSWWLSIRFYEKRELE